MTDSAAGSPLALAELTTLRVGGVPERMVTATTQRDLVDAALDVWADGDEWLLLGGGSNTVASDEPFDGTVIRVATRGIEVLPTDAAAPGRVRVRVQAGEPWDDLVAYTVGHGWAGIEALSGIPGSTGAAPVQNIGAYGQELSSSLVAIDFLDYITGEVSGSSAAELELGYRTSVLKQGRQGIVLAVELELHDTAGEQAVLGGALGSRSRTRSWPAPSACSSATGFRCRRCAMPCSRCGRPRAWCWTRTTPTPPAPARSSPTRSSRENFARGLPADAPRWPLTPDTADVVVPLGHLASGTPLDAFLTHQEELAASRSMPAPPHRTRRSSSSAPPG